MSKALLSLALAIAASGGGLAFMYSGFADVAATSPHWTLTRWVLSTTMEGAAQKQAKRIALPAFIDEEQRVRAGAVAYDEMCSGCHGAPGVEPGVVGKGLNPEPPDLAKVADGWSPEEIFWITEHGVRMTGMPAVGPTHSDEELREVVALVKRYRASRPPSTGRSCLLPPGRAATGTLTSTRARRSTTTATLTRMRVTYGKELHGH